MAADALISIAVFVAVFLVIVFEWVHRSVAAVLGVLTLLVLGVIDVHSAAVFVDAETIMLLIGMMGIVAILKKSGFFTILTVKVAKWTAGQPVRILVLFFVSTAVISAFLDNVTTVLIMVPIVIELTEGLGVDPRVYVVALAMAANLGGTATLVGDPPNIIIGSKVGLTFNQFLTYLVAPVAISSAGVLAYFRMSNRESFRSIDDNLTKLFPVKLLVEKIELDFAANKIDRKFLLQSVVFLAIALLLFVTQTITHLSPGIVALSVATLLFIVTKTDVEHILLEIEWSTILFFVSLFILVGAMEEKGVIEWIAQKVFLRAGENPYVTTLLVLWVSGIVSGFLDNIPFTITMIPIVQTMLNVHPVPHYILWWALSLGACMGGNLTIIGASANIVSAGMMKKYGYDISFGEYFRKSAPGTILSLVISSLVLIVYLWIFL